MRALLKLGAVFLTTGLLVSTHWGHRPLTARADTLVETQGALGSGDAILDDGSLYDQYTFSATSGQYVTISLESEDFDPYLILLDPNGQRISENDDVSRANRNSRVIVTLPSTGLYTAVANSYESGKNGRYAIKIDIASNRRTLSEALASSAVPESTAACSDAIATMTLNVEGDRDVSAWVSALPLERVYSQLPSLRPHGVTVALSGPAAVDMMSSPQLLTQLSADLVADCATVSAVVFNTDTPAAERTFGFLPGNQSGRSQAVQGDAAAELVEGFNCVEPTEESTLLGWGEQVCP